MDANYERLRDEAMVRSRTYILTRMPSEQWQEAADQVLIDFPLPNGAPVDFPPTPDLPEDPIFVDPAPPVDPVEEPVGDMPPEGAIIR